jgi:hypothetical protein
MIRIASISALVLSIASLTGCGSTSDSTPLATPLAGTIEKKTFTAKSAIALTGEMPNTKFVVIRNAEATCSDGSTVEAGVLVVTVETPWKDGATADVGGDAKVTFDDPPDSILAVSGQVDVVHGPMALGARGILRVLADALDGASKVDGQVDVAVCQ